MNLNHKTVFMIALGMALLFGDTSRADGLTSRVFDVKESGAKGDGKTLDTDAIQKTLDDCAKAGGGTVRFPAGTYLSKPIVLRGSSTTVQLDAGATLLATDDPADFAGATSNSFIPFISGKNLHDITITGQGTVDGSGARWWIPAEAARQKTPGYTLPRPNLVVLTGCTNLRIENITLQNSPKFHLVPTDCDGVIISNVTVLAPAHAANTDAIDPSACRNVVITKCRIDVGDDNIAIKAGRAQPGRLFACDNILVTDCTFLHGHGMSIGSETAGGVHNVTVRNCTFENTENGIRIKSQRGRGGVVENISYSDITMKNVDPAITLTSYYMFNSAGDAKQKSEPAKDTAQAVAAGTPIYRNIHISNLTATCQRAAGIIIGLPESLISDVTLENVQITSATTGLKIQNAKGIQFKNVQITAQQGPPVIMDNAEVTGIAAPQPR